MRAFPVVMAVFTLYSPMKPVRHLHADDAGPIESKGFIVCRRR